MNVSHFTLDANRFATACATFSKADGYITKTIAEAHKAGRSALCDVIAALALCKVPFAAALANTIRVTAHRARKAYNSEFTITVSSHGKTFAFELARTADIQRKPGAGRKPAKSPAQGSSDTGADTARAHAQRDAAIAAAKHYADALRVLGFSDVELKAIVDGSMTPAAIRAHVSPKLPAARKPAARKVA